MEVDFLGIISSPLLKQVHFLYKSFQEKGRCPDNLSHILEPSV